MDMKLLVDATSWFQWGNEHWWNPNDGCEHIKLSNGLTGIVTNEEMMGYCKIKKDFVPENEL